MRLSAISAAVALAASAALSVLSPATAFAEGPTPSGKKKLLLVTHSGGFIHGSVKQAEITMKELGEKNGFEVTTFRFTNDPDKKVKAKKKDAAGKEVEVEATALEAYSAKFPGGVDKEHAGRLDRETLAKFDAVFFFTTGNPAETREEQAALIDFVTSGKGFIGAHCATDTLYGFKDYGDMIGGYFNGHPWHTKVTVSVEDQNHPTMKGLGDKFEITDEIYQMRDPYTREKLHILARLDPAWLASETEKRTKQLEDAKKNLDAEVAKREAAAKIKAEKLLADAEAKAKALETDGKAEDAKKLREAAKKDADKALAEPAAYRKQIETAKPGHGGARKDEDYALMWCREFGKGRVFYTALGHRDEVWKDPRFQNMIISAVKWTTREIDGDATPSAAKK